MVRLAQRSAGKAIRIVHIKVCHDTERELAVLVLELKALKDNDFLIVNTIKETHFRSTHSVVRSVLFVIRPEDHRCFLVVREVAFLFGKFNTETTLLIRFSHIHNLTEVLRILPPHIFNLYDFSADTPVRIHFKDYGYRVNDKELWPLVIEPVVTRHFDFTVWVFGNLINISEIRIPLDTHDTETLFRYIIPHFLLKHWTYVCGLVQVIAIPLNVFLSGRRYRIVFQRLSDNCWFRHNQFAVEVNHGRSKATRCRDCGSKPFIAFTYTRKVFGVHERGY